MSTFTVIDAPQRSDAWRLARAGRATGSRARDILATLKGGGEAAARRDYRIQLCCERLVGEPQDSAYENDDMRRGVELEPEAVALYEATTGHIVTTSGFLSHNTLMCGASVDGHVGEYGLIEVKVPRPANHLKHIRSGGIPTEHRAQLVHSLWLTGAQWIDFVSYSPSFPDGPLRLFVHRLARDADELATYEKSLLAFLKEVDRELEAIRTMANVGAVLAEAASA